MYFVILGYIEAVFRVERIFKVIVGFHPTYSLRWRSTHRTHDKRRQGLNAEFCSNVVDPTGIFLRTEMSLEVLERLVQ